LVCFNFERFVAHCERYLASRRIVKYVTEKVFGFETRFLSNLF
jgi:hypothetical protein